MRRNYRLTALYSVLVISTLVVVFTTPQPAQAWTGSYTTKWDVDSYLVAGRSTINDEIVYGISKWKVTGNFADLYYREIWSVPDQKPIISSDLSVSYTGDQTQHPENKWLVGVMSAKVWNNLTLYDFSVKELAATKVGQLKRQAYTLNNVDYNLGSTNSCSGDYMCLYQDGSYSFTDFDKLASAGEGRYRETVFTMPLEWNISGLVCSKQEDCK